MKEAQPTLFFGVPRVWEKIHEKMLAVGRQNKNFIHRQVKQQDVRYYRKKLPKLSYYAYTVQAVSNLPDLRNILP